MPVVTPALFLSVNAPPTTATHTLSLHDALPISTTKLWGCRTVCVFFILLFPFPLCLDSLPFLRGGARASFQLLLCVWTNGDRKSTRLNSSHRCISYAVFCLKKKTSTVTYILT